MPPHPSSPSCPPPSFPSRPSVKIWRRSFSVLGSSKFNVGSSKFRPLTSDVCLLTSVSCPPRPTRSRQRFGVRRCRAAFSPPPQPSCHPPPPPAPNPVGRESPRAAPASARLHSPAVRSPCKIGLATLRRQVHPRTMKLQSQLCFLPQALSQQYSSRNNG